MTQITRSGFSQGATDVIMLKLRWCLAGFSQLGHCCAPLLQLFCASSAHHNRQYMGWPRAHTLFATS